MNKFTLVFISLLVILCNFPAFALPNPASVNCVKTGGKLILVKNTGICIFSDKSYCEEWAYFRARCNNGQNRLPKNFNENTVDQYCVVNVGKKQMLALCESNQ